MTSVRGTTLEQAIGTVEASLVETPMSGLAPLDIIKVLSTEWANELLDESFAVPAKGVSIASQYKATAVYDGTSLTYTVEGTTIVIRQTIGVIAIQLPKQGTAGMTDAELEVFLEKLAGKVLRALKNEEGEATGPRNWDLGISATVEGYRIFTQTIPPERETDDWMDDLKVLEKDNDVFFVTSKRKPEGDSSNDVSTSPQSNVSWFAISSSNSKVRFIP
jgi:hypothetical protein